MERHRCKLCSRSFMNGRALGGHMRSHLATFPLPLKKQTKNHGNSNSQLGGGTESDSSSTRSEDENKLSSYELRDNPRKSVKALDPEFMDAGSIVVQDRESETESTQNPTRRRSKRASQRTNKQLGFEVPKKIKWVGSESAAESTPVSSVSDPSNDEEVALCLMMLSRDAWERVEKEEEKEKSVEDTNDSAAELRTGLITRPATRVAAKFKCFGCKKVFRTGRALAGHKASNRQCCLEKSPSDDHVGPGVKIFECPFCYKVFGSGQALGGHKRSHLLGSSSTNNNNNNANVVASNNADRVGETTTTTTTNTSFILDLNLPAPFEDDEDDHIS